MERDKLFKAIATIEALLIVGMACEGRRPISVEATATPPTPIVKPLPEATVFPTLAPMETLSPSATPEIYPQELVQLGQKMAITIETADGPIGIEILPKPYEEGLVEFRAYKDGVALVNPTDGYGNMVFQIHSGYAQNGEVWEVLPAEGLRYFVQGGNWSGALAEYDLATQDQKIRSLLGASAWVDQAGTSGQWRVAAVQRVAHADLADFRRDTYEYVDRLVEYAARDGIESLFQEAKGDHGIVAVISLRARQGDVTDNKWSHEALALYLVP